MQQQTIPFDSARQAKQNLSIKAWATKQVSNVRTWLHGRSEFYSRIAEFEVTRLLALRINLVTLCIIVGIITVQQQPIVALSAAISSAWLVSRLNKKGGTR